MNIHHHHHHHDQDNNSICSVELEASRRDSHILSPSILPDASVEKRPSQNFTVEGGNNLEEKVIQKKGKHTIPQLIRFFLALVALSLHAMIEGLVVGVQVSQIFSDSSLIFL